MKKIIALLVLVALFATSCADKNAYTLSGNFSGNEYDGQVVYLQELGRDLRSYNNIDSTTVANGTFSFKGVAQTPVLRFITLADASKRVRGIFMAEPGKIVLTFSSDERPQASVSGTASNDSYQAFSSKINSLEDEAAFSQAVYDYLKANINNPIGQYVFTTTSYALNVDQLKEFLPQLSAEMKSSERIQSIEKRIPALEATAVGQQFTDVKGKTPDGKDIALSDYVGNDKIVLVDFWASWCPPCREDMPKVVAIYDKYKDKGFEIVGISIDHDNAAWIKGIEDLNITWPQMSDLLGWKSVLSNTYGVASIPHTVLIDKDGKIIERGLSPEKLEAKLAELIK